MEVVRLLAAQGRYSDISDQAWSLLTQSQKFEVLGHIPITKDFKLYSKLCPDPVIYQEWYSERALESVDLIGPGKALELLDFVYNVTKSAHIKQLMDNMIEYSKVLKYLDALFQSLSIAITADSETRVNHIVDVLQTVRFPLNVDFLIIEPWLCLNLLSADLGSKLNVQLSENLVRGNNFEDQLFALSELNYRQVSLSMEAQSRSEVDLNSLLSSLRSSQPESLSIARSLLGPTGYDINTRDDLRAALTHIIKENQSLAVSAADQVSDWSILEPVLRSNSAGLASIDLQVAFECLTYLSH
jgi:hypothetical protein